MVEEQVEESTEQQVEETSEEIQETPVQETEADQAEVTEPVYEPDYTYKAYDEQHEFDEWAKAVLQAEGLGSKDLEENLRALYAKAGGFEKRNEEYNSLKGTYKELQGTYGDLAEDVKELLYYRDKDLDTFFDKTDISKQRLFDYVQAKLEEEKMDPVQRSQLQANRRALVDSYVNQREADRLRAENEELSSSSFKTEFDRAMSIPDAVSFSKKFDELYGAGAFKEEVANYGSNYYRKNGVETTPLDAVLQTIDRHRPVMDRLSEPARELVEAKKAQDEGKPKGHIPNIGGGSAGSSPTNKRPKDMETFKKLIADRLEQLREG